MTIRKRKQDHVELCVDSDVTYRKSAGFEGFEFQHDALPELNLKDISTSASLLGREFAFPLFVSSMTGGYSGAAQINSSIARFCERENLPFGVGSQRVMLEDSSEEAGFRLVRKEAPGAFICANIGGVQIAGKLTPDQIDQIIDVISADAIIVHLNPLQELMQPEGDRTFEGVEEGIARLVTRSPVPVIVKETGAGISDDVSRRLLAVGVSVIDVSGAGGTSWARVESIRSGNDAGTMSSVEESFEEWGIPTAECIEQVNRHRETFRFEMIASGGIRTPFDMAKALALGADFTAVAQPVISALVNGGEDQLVQTFDKWKDQFRMILALLGCRNPSLLGAKHLRRVRRNS